jgi:hypothetical protein
MEVSGPAPLETAGVAAVEVGRLAKQRQLFSKTTLTESQTQLMP